MGTAEGQGEDGALTEKQRRVLDLLIENKTSKEIARDLGISPHTVDQRILLARGRLGANSRTELATRYRAMRSGPPLPRSDRPENYQPNQQEDGDYSEGCDLRPADQGEQAVIDQEHEHDEPPAAPARMNGERNFFPTSYPREHRVGPEVFEGKTGRLWRLGAIVVTALLLVMTILGLFAIFDQLNDMLA